MQAPTVEVRTDQSNQADSTFNLNDPQRDLDILRTLRDAVQAGIHPLFRVPSKLRPLPFAPTDPPAEEVEEPTPLPVVTSPNPVPSCLPAPTLPSEPSPSSPPPPPPAEPEPEAVQEVVPAPQDEQDTDSLISYEELEAQQEQEIQEERPQVEPEAEAEIEETDSDSDSDSDLEVAAQLIKPSRSLPSISTTTRPSASQQPTEVVVLSSDSESSGDPDDIIFEDVVEVASADQSPRPAPSQELQRQSYVRRDAPQDGLTLLDNADPTERADPPTSRSRLPDYDTLSRDDRDDTVMTTEDNRCQDPTDEREPERLREGQDGFDSAFGPTKEEEEEKLRQLAAAREREAAAAPTRGISLPATDRRETRGERKDREAREVAERRAKEKAERESTEREREPTALSSSNISECEVGSKEEAHAQTVKNAYQIHQHGQPAPPTPNFPPPPHVQARLNSTNPDSRVAPSVVQHHQPNRPYSPPRSRPDIRRRSLSPPRRREYESRFDDRAPPQPFSSQPASFSRAPPTRGRSPVPIRTRTPPTPPSTYSNYPPVRRAPSLARSIDGGRRQRSRSPPRRPLSTQIDDRRFAPAPPPPALRDDRRPLPPPVDERYRRNGPPPTVYDRERDYPPPPASFQYRGPPPPVAMRARSRSPPPLRASRGPSPLPVSSSRYASQSDNNGYYPPHPPSVTLDRSRANRSPPLGATLRNSTGPGAGSRPLDRWEETDRRERRYSGGSIGAPPLASRGPPPPSHARYDDRPQYDPYGRPPSPPHAARGIPPPLARRAPSPPPVNDMRYRGPPPPLVNDRDREYLDRRGPPPSLDRPMYREDDRRYTPDDRHPYPPPNSYNDYPRRPITPPPVRSNEAAPVWRPYEGGVANGNRRGPPPPLLPRGSPPGRRR